MRPFAACLCLVSFVGASTSCRPNAASTTTTAKSPEGVETHSPSTPPPAKGHAEVAGDSVILITLDGVRWQDIFQHPAPFDDVTTDPLPYFHALFRSHLLLGDARAGETVRTASLRPLSLPGYQAIFSGFQTGCAHNACATKANTVFDHAASALGEPKKVAIFASWMALRYAISELPSPSFHYDIPTLETLDADPNPPPWKFARWDDETHIRALEYYKRHRPRLLAVSYLDTDEWAHRGERARYVDALKAFDRHLKEWVDAAQSAQLLRNTWFIVTTDHGRDDGNGWTDHGDSDAGTKVWLAIAPPASRMTAFRIPAKPTQADVRPTIEAILKLPSWSCTHSTCGATVVLPARSPDDGP